MTATLPHRQVRAARGRELGRTARLHEQLLPGGFFARLGPRFLRRYHATFAASPLAEILVLDDGRAPAGMLVGTYDNAAHYRWVLRRRSPRLALAGLLALLRRPRHAVEFLRTRPRRYGRAVWRYLGRRRQPAPSASADGPGRVAVLAHVAVEREAQGDGAGRRLVRAFEERAREHGAEEARLVTPSGGPGPRFYRSLGWHHLVSRRAADGTVVDEFVLPL